ncbi:sodium:proton antiporter [Cetobacterium sp. 2A]|uniref:Na+/H+ antiporter family protein n=1 Tax=unclassified Cetobacterium TaxID=2630983 RepID=UPI00163BE075|nr:Na+/H+ antiporter NhaC family protein [Cetobacterium sp. 2A]MBC2855426.1 sodium:proton antiporter [Cetobacterium sp. 2A]
MIFNPVILSVTTMIILSLLKLNVIFAILIAALVAGITSGMSLSSTMSTLIGGMGGNSETALSYILLGALAVAISNTGVASILAKKISKIVSGRKWILLFIIATIACFSQNLIPVHIAFIPILIPPLLKLMDELKLDRRSMACALTFGLKMPYIVMPVGFGLIFHTIVKDQIIANGVAVELSQVWRSTWILGLAMLSGLFIAVFITYSKNRDYQLKPLVGEKNVVAEVMEPKHWITLVAAIVAFSIQLYTGSLPLGAIVAIAIMLATKVVKWDELDSVLNGGIGIMGLIAFIMLVAAGYGSVIRETGAVTSLVTSVSGFVGGSKFIGSSIMLLVGLFVTMGIGTSFGTIPILAAIYVPLALELGISPAGTIVLIAAAGALGDAGSPASDSTLGPTAGLNADGQHDHIWDTCVPTFLHYNIPLLIAGLIGGVLF